MSQRKSNAPTKRVKRVQPSSRILPRSDRLGLTDEFQKEITDLAQAAHNHHHGKREPDNLELSVIMAPTRVASAIAWYVSGKEYETSLPEFRRQIDRKNKKSLPFAIQTLLDRLPGDAIPPVAQIRSLFCYGDAESNGINSRDTAAELAEKNRREDRWSAQLSARTMRATLEQWLELFDDLKTQTGTGRSPVEAEKGFVRALAAYWKTELKLPIANSRTDAERSGQDGFFAKFIVKAAEGIPRHYGKDARWDHAVREVAGEKGSEN